MSEKNPNVLEDAIALALEAHRGQLDKAGSPYILHPLRVMARMNTDADRIAAVLHDSVEDSEGRVTFERIAAIGVPAEALDAIRLLTRTDDGSEAGYAAYVERVAAHPVARRVKLADLEDNLDARRLAAIGERDAARLTRYLHTYRKLRTAE